MRITAPHYFDFGADRRHVGDDLVRPEAWDALRTETAGPFALPASREAWEQALGGRPELEQRARRIDALLAELGAESLASYGVGVAMIEFWLHKLRPERPLRLGEYAPATVGRLRDVFPEVEVRQHDLLADPPLPGDWHLFHRIDTEFSNRQWRRILRRFRDRSILFVATEIIDLSQAIRELRSKFSNPNATRSGLIRNRPAFEALWRRTHRAEPVEVADLQGWVLTPR
jgi:hypothetical protein